MNYQHEKDTRFLFLMSVLSEATGQDCGEFKIKIYATALSDMSIAEIDSAVWHLVKTRTTASFPKVAEIRNVIEGRGPEPVDKKSCEYQDPARLAEIAHNSAARDERKRLEDEQILKELEAKGYRPGDDIRKYC